MILWWLLALSSIPLHLLYNSTVFSTLSTQEYNVFLVSDDYTQGAPFDVTPAMISGYAYARGVGPRSFCASVKIPAKFDVYDQIRQRGLSQGLLFVYHVHQFRCIVDLWL